MKNLLLALTRCARLLRPLKIPLVISTLFALLLTSYCLLANSGLALDLLEPAIVASLWGMLILACIELFQKVPEPVFSKDPFLHRLLAHCKIFAYSLLALISILVGVLLVWLSLRLLFI